MADGVQKREILDLKSVNELLPGEFIRSLLDPSGSWQLKKAHQKAYDLHQSHKFRIVRRMNSSTVAHELLTACLKLLGKMQQSTEWVNQVLLSQMIEQGLLLWEQSEALQQIENS